jgi:hypothetical protein
MPFVNPLEEDVSFQMPDTDTSFRMEPEEGLTFGGALEAISAGGTSGLLQLAKLPGQAKKVGFVDPIITPTIDILKGLIGIPRDEELVDDVKNAQEFLRGKFGDTKAEQILGQAAESITAMGSAIAVGATTSGALSPLVLMSAGAGIDKTETALAEGAPKLNAYGAGFVSAATEYVTELLSWKALAAPAGNFFKRLALGAINDIPGEMAATAMELSVIKQYLEIMKDTAAVAALTTAGLSGGAQLVHNLTPDAENPATGISEALSATVIPESTPAVVEEVIEVAPRRESNVNFNAVQLLGITDDLNEAGYITPEGKLVDLSGKKEGLPAGKRSLGHSMVAYEDATRLGEDEFKSLGNIRMDFSDHTLDMKTEPTEKQYRLIAKIAKDIDGELWVDMDNGLGELIEFPGEEGFDSFYNETPNARRAIFEIGTRPSKVIAAIKSYYKNVPNRFTQEQRNDSKSEFPELESQTNYVNPAEQLDLTPETAPIPDPIEIEPVNVHDTEAFKANTWSEVMEASDKMSKDKRKFSISKLWRSFVRGAVSSSGNIEADLNKLGNDGKRVALRRNALAGAHSKALKEVDIAKREIFSGLNTNQRKTFNGYISALRHLEIRANKGAKFKLPGNATEQMLHDYINNIPEKDLPQFEERAAKWSQSVGSILDIMTQEGLLTEKKAAKARAAGKYYVPRQVLEFIDPLVQQKGRDGKTISVRDSGLQNLTETGSDKLVENDSEMLLEQVYERAWTRIFRNRANLELLNLARTMPNNKIVREAKVVGRTRQAFQIIDKKTGEVVEEEAFETKKEARDEIRGSEDEFAIKQVKFGAPVFEQPKPSEMRISAMEGGKKRELIMPLESGQEWIRSDPILSAGWANIIGWASGNKILKSMATTLNPEFAITNIPRDLAHIWLTTNEYSSIAPISAMQMGNDIRQVIGQAISAKGLKKTQLYQDYIDNGGGTEFLSHQGRTGIKGLNPVSKVFVGLEKIMGVAGESSEILTRLALMNRAMRNGKSKFEATQIARGYLDFSQGGSVAKAIDTAIPFMNAGIQATRGIVRASKNNPALFTAKVFQIGTMAASLYWANRSMYGDEVEDVPDTEQKNNFIIFTPYTSVDSEGNERHYYVRIPKDQGQRAFAAIFEGFAKKRMGVPVDVDLIVDAVKDFSPVTLTDQPPIVEALLGYSVNKDFWRREDIWRGEDVLPQEEYNKYTPAAYVRAGEATGLSPMRMQYAVNQLFTRGNIWTSLAGYGAKQVFDEMTPEQRLNQTKELFERQPFVRRLLRSTRPDIRRKKEIAQEKERIETERLRTNRQLDALIEAEATGRTDNAEITEFIRRNPIPERKRLRRRRKAMRRLRDVQNKGFWFDLLDLPPESRAVNYWNRWSQLDEAGRKELDRQSRKVPGFRSKRFNRSFNKMRRLR